MNPHSQSVQNARVREEARLRAEHGYELSEDIRVLAGDTERRRAADRRILEEAGILESIEVHAASAIFAAPKKWDFERWSEGSVTGR